MGLLKKLNTALDILRSREVVGVFRTIKAKMARPQPDESLIILLTYYLPAPVGGS
jgi:hypothetical protein